MQHRSWLSKVLSRISVNLVNLKKNCETFQRKLMVLMSWTFSMHFVLFQLYGELVQKHVQSSVKLVGVSSSFELDFSQTSRVSYQPDVTVMFNLMKLNFSLNPGNPRCYCQPTVECEVETSSTVRHLSTYSFIM